MANAGHDGDQALRAISLHALWESRKEDINACTAKVSKLAQLLESASPTFFSGWARKGRSRRIALQTEKLDLGDIEVAKSLLLRGRNRRDTEPRMIIDQLGFSLDLWNQELHGVSASISVHCGSYTPNVGNWVSVEFSPKVKELTICARDQIDILKGMINIWKPTIGALSRRAVQAHPLGLSSEPTVLQLAYFSVPGHDDHPIWRPSGKIVEQIDGGSFWINERLRSHFEV
jgi:hypothetical protein